MKKMATGLGVLALVFATGCGDDGEAGGPSATSFELAGTWSSGFGDETISDTRWDGFCTQKITRFSNEDNVAILETDGGEGCGGGFSRVVWNDIVGDAFDYCTTAFGEPSAADAEAAPQSAISDDLATGCGGFPWSRLTRK